MDVSIVIVNYHSSQLINNCVASIFEKTVGIDYEVIIVDNASEDLSTTIAAFGDSRIKTIQLKSNLGFGNANNEGFRIAAGRNILCLNPDTILISNAVKTLSDYLDSHPECGACGGNIFSDRMMPALSFRRLMPGITWELNALLFYAIDFIRFGKNQRFNRSGKPLEVAYVSGACLMMPKTVVETNRGFSPEFFMYYEETDLCRRIRKSGKKIVNVPQAEIKHLDGKCHKNPKDRSKLAKEGRATYYRRNCGRFERGIANFIHKL